MNESYSKIQKRNQERAKSSIDNGLGRNKELIAMVPKKDYRPLKMRIMGISCISFFLFNWLFFNQSMSIFQGIFGYTIGGLFVMFCMFPGIFLLFFAGIVMIVYAPYGKVPDMWTKYWFYSGPTVSENNHGGQYNNIDRVNEYVNCKASISDRDSASSMMTKMGAINSMSNTSEGRRSLEYMNAKMSLMTREDGFKFLSGKLKD